MIPGSADEVEYGMMLDSLFKMSYLDNEDVKQKLMEDRLLHKKPSSSESSAMKTWEIDFEFYLNQLCHPQAGSIGSADTELCKRRETQNLKAMATQKRIDEEKQESINRGHKATEHEVMDEIGAYHTLWFMFAER